MRRSLSVVALFGALSLLTVARVTALEPQGPLAIAPVVLSASTTLATFPAGTFLENLAPTADGAVVVTSFLEGAVYRVTTGKRTRIAHVAGGHLAGIARLDDGGYLLDGTDAARVPHVWHMTAAGALDDVASLPSAKFLNGIARLDTRRYLVADSYLGTIFVVDTRAKSVRAWLHHPLLARSDPKATFPALNGMKRHGNTLYVSNTQRRLFLKIPVDAAGAPGTPSVFVRNLNLDDFDVADDGTIVATTHVFDRVVRIDPSGALTVIAGPEQGVVGCTAASIVRTGAHRGDVIITTNGGMTAPPPSGVGPGLVVRLATAQAK